VGPSATGRFAPSTTGPAHAGTLLAALLCWLDARSRGARVVLRLEDLDPKRCRPAFADRMEADLAWLGLDWDARMRQSEAGAAHEAALDALAASGRLYPCRCTRADLRRAGARSPDGAFPYTGVCRSRRLPAGGWRASPEPLRVRLDDGVVRVRDEGGDDLSHDPAATFGDPVVRRRDGAVAYHLAAVVDDAGSGVGRVVRGRDLAMTTPTQVALRRLLGLPVPVHRHHLLLLEPRGGKLAKLHGSASAAELRSAMDGPGLCATLARLVGLLPEDGPRSCRPAQLVADFDWERVRSADRVVRWTGRTLDAGP